MAYNKSSNYTIYAYIAPDGRRYIGKTGAQQHARAGSGGAGYKHCGRFWKAITRYGWESFKYEILAVIPKSIQNAAEIACKKESEYIQRYQTTNILYGFNRNKVDTPRTYEKLSQARKNRRVVNKDGVVRHIPGNEFDVYIANGWNPGYG